jgi:2-polyprenyl-3-methyl-5-hydroxy-6-metoxy-1,4-benzoquinol methylase
MQTESEPPSPLTNADAIRAWEAGADRVGDFDDEGDAARRWLLNPTIFTLLGEPTGRSILDVGCGQGYLCRLLAHRGARVTGLEPATPWYAAAVGAEDANPQGIVYVQADLSTLSVTHPQLLGAFDTVIANMVLIDIPDYEAAIRSCAAALLPGGVFICTLLHPCFEESSIAWLEKRSVETRDYLHPTTREQRIGYLFHRPLSHYINTLLDAGFTLRRMIEPQLSEEGARIVENNRDCYVPSYIALYLVRE